MKKTEQTPWFLQPILASLLKDSQFLLVCIFVPVVIVVLHVANIFSWKCPVKFVTSLSCPGCGMTRAGIALSHGDFAAAASYHPFSFIFAGLWGFFVILLFLPKQKRQVISAKFAQIEEKTALIPVLFTLFVFFGLARLFFQIYD